MLLLKVYEYFLLFKRINETFENKGIFEDICKGIFLI